MTESKEQKQAIKRSNVRWLLVALMFIAITFNYADREIWVLTEPAFSVSFGWSKSGAPLSHYALMNISLILFIWSLAYAIFNFPGGWITDKLGIRKAMATFFGLWSAFTALTASTFNFISMAVVRGLMGASEGPVWPINSKVSKNWASIRDPSKAFTWAGSGQALGPIIGLAGGAALYALWGWRGVFLFFGILGILLAIAWYALSRDKPEEHPWVNKAELDYIREGKAMATEPTLRSSDTWKIALRIVFTTQAGIGVLLTFISFGYILYTFLYWLPPLMYGEFAHSVTASGYYSAAIDMALFIGFIASGPFNDWLVARYGKVMGRRLGSIVPMSLMIAAVALSYFTGTAHELLPTALLLATAAGLMNLTVGSYAVNGFDIAPPGVTATVYGIYNGILNLMGAFNSIIIGYLFIKYGPFVGFTSAVFFMVLFLAGYLVFIRESTWKRAVDYGYKLVQTAINRA
ncbi:MAG: MFS transporter [Vulcanisaeta sp.]|jgi:MFS family permease|uniref:MFS transporter n=1 Tax=Vulcanisaeta sp. TaxID=2020871 RepID=UPI003D0B08F0